MLLHYTAGMNLYTKIVYFYTILVYDTNSSSSPAQLNSDLNFKKLLKFTKLTKI